PIVSKGNAIGIHIGRIESRDRNTVDLLAIPFDEALVTLIGRVVAREFAPSAVDQDSLHTTESEIPGSEIPTVTDDSPTATASESAQQEFDADAFFKKLSPSSLRALAHAEAIRSFRDRNEIHLEYLIAGLFEYELGPTRALFQEHGVTEDVLVDLIKA